MAPDSPSGPLYDKVLRVGGVLGLVAVMLVLGGLAFGNNLLTFVTTSVNTKLDTMIEEQRHSNQIHGQMLEAIKDLKETRYTYQPKP